MIEETFFNYVVNVLDLLHFGWIIVQSRIKDTFTTRYMYLMIKNMYNI